MILEHLLKVAFMEDKEKFFNKSAQAYHQMLIFGLEERLVAQFQGEVREDYLNLMLYSVHKYREACRYEKGSLRNKADFEIYLAILIYSDVFDKMKPARQLWLNIDDFKKYIDDLSSDQQLLKRTVLEIEATAEYKNFDPENLANISTPSEISDINHSCLYTCPMGVIIAFNEIHYLIPGRNKGTRMLFKNCTTDEDRDQRKDIKEKAGKKVWEAVKVIDVARPVSYNPRRKQWHTKDSPIYIILKMGQDAARFFGLTEDEHIYAAKSNFLNYVADKKIRKEFEVLIDKKSDAWKDEVDEGLLKNADLMEQFERLHKRYSESEKQSQRGSSRGVGPGEVMQV